MRIDVTVLATRTDARAAFARRRAKTNPRTQFYGIGDDAFAASNGTHVVRTENFLLVVDPTQLDAPTERDQIGWATTRAIFDCW